MWQRCNLAAKGSGLECACVDNDNFTVLVSVGYRHCWVSMCTVWPLHKMTEWAEQWICIKFCAKLEHSSVETIWMIQKAFGDKAMSAVQTKVSHECFKDGQALAGVSLSASRWTKRLLVYSQSGHMLGLWARCPVGHARGTRLMYLLHREVSLPLFLLPFPSLKNK